MADLIQLKGIGKTFPQRFGPGVTILRDVDLTIGEGESVCVLGESGCGKTTLGKIIAGLSTYTEGSFTFEGKEVSKLKGADWDCFRNSIQMIHQNPYESLNPSSMVFDIIANPIRRHEKIKDINQLYPRVTRLLELVGLTPVEDFVDKYPGALSGGQRQRVSIARTLAMNPKLIVVDEATSMIDTSLRISLLSTMKKIQAELGVSYFFITHDLALGRYFAEGQRVMIMYLGRVVEEGKTETLIQTPAHPYTRAILSAAAGSSNILEKAQENRFTLRGTDIPSFNNIPTGCSLHPRCPLMIDGRCSAQLPELTALEDETHRAACHLYGECK